MKLSDKVRHHAWARRALTRTETELEPLIRTGFSIPREPGGWWHDYVCPRHGTELLFDPTEDDAQVYTCPHGCKLSGEPYRSAWLVYRHQELARAMLGAASVYAASSESKYADISKSILLRYAAQYPHYPIHPDARPWMLKGRAFHQALTEAVWATTLFRGWLLLEQEGIEWDEHEQQVLGQFVEMVRESMEQYRDILIYHQQRPMSNYTAWLNAALSGVYAITRDRDNMMHLIRSEGGLEHHLNIAVKSDQLEYEGSVYYHLFVLRAYLITAEMAERVGLDVYDLRGKDGQSFVGMLDATAALADSNGKLPALHDSPYDRIPYARERAEVFEIGSARYGCCAAYASVLTEAYRHMYGKGERTGLEALLYGEADDEKDMRPAPRQSIVMDPTGLAVLRHAAGPWSAIVDYGEHGGSHGHHDKLHLILFNSGWAVAPDQGVVPYGSSMRKLWYQATASHNTISVNGRNQAKHIGKRMAFCERQDSVYAWFRSDAAYSGCVIDRHLLLTEWGLIDRVIVRQSQSGAIDWRMHLNGVLHRVQPKLWSEPAEADIPDWTRIMVQNTDADEHGTSISDGSEWIRVRATARPGAGQVQFRLQSDGGETCAITLLTRKVSELSEIESPGTADDPSRLTVGIGHRQHASEAEFITLYHQEPDDIQVPLDSERIIGDVVLRMMRKGRMLTYRFDS